ncbi:lipopolysaccharide biosynthesis protein [Pseudocolwellia sp. HL-MZ19]|uniref:lipopolysaccharide biosynthesis protein n=1 Tax=Pseudocolwellia sp. HL-MZ19 TaxID=3400846 RepID=UPI003CF9F229
MVLSGTAGVSLANFLLSGLLVLFVAPNDFGTYAFMQLFITFGTSLSSALIGSPLMYFMNSKEYETNDELINGYFFINIVFSLTCSVFTFCIALYLLDSLFIASLFSTSAFFTWLRWFGRSYMNTIHKPEVVALSDVCYTVSIFCGVIVLYLFKFVNLENFVALQFLGSLISSLVIGKEFLFKQLRSLKKVNIKGFLDGYRLKGKHSFIAALTTEATTNIHSYIIVLFWGPAVFAPIAAIILFYRPTSMVTVSLIQLERPKMAKYLNDNFSKGVITIMNNLRLFVLITWFFNLSLGAIAILFFDDLVTKEGYDFNVIVSVMIVYGVINFLKCFRVPSSAYLQANGEFKVLSKFTIISALITLPLVISFSYVLGPLWSLLGIILGELYVTGKIHFYVKKSFKIYGVA